MKFPYSRRTRRGGVILYKTHKQDIMTELIRYANGDIKFINNGTYGFTFQLKSDISTILTRDGCGLESILVKLIAIDSPLYFAKNKVEVVDVTDFKNEVSIQEDICARSLEMFHCSIVPTVLHAGVYTHEEFMTHFPKIGENVITQGRIGIIFMENIADSKTIHELFEQDKQNVIENLFPRMRRMLIMLAKLGFLHNDYKFTNWLVSGEALFLIDFGMATRIKDTFDESDVTSMISFLSLNTDELDEKYTGYILELQWLRQEQIDTFTEEIDPDIKIALQSSITSPIFVAERELCVLHKMPSIEKYHVLSKSLPKVLPTKISILAELSKDPYLYERLSPDLQRDPEIIQVTLKTNGELLSHVPEELRDEDNVRIAVRSRGWALKDVPNVFKTKEIVHLAVSNRGNAIQFSPENLKSDPDIIRAAVSKDGAALKFVPKDQITKEIASIALSKNGNVLHFIPIDIMDDEIVLSAVMNNGDALEYVPEELKTKKLYLLQ